MELKAQLLEEGNLYSFSKATMGSYKHFVSNHYKLGYMMVRYGRRTYGDRFWIDFQQYAARKPYLLNPTYFSMRKYGLRSKNQFYRDALENYRKHWTRMAADRKVSPFVDWHPNRNREYTSYTFPHYISGSMMFAYKSGLDQIPEFIFLDQGGEEQRIFRPGYLSSGRISFSGSHVVWDEYVPDTRWSNRNYSVIKTYEIGTGMVNNLGRKTRYYSPAVSNDGSRIAAIEQTELQKFNLVILTLDGSIERVIPSPQNQFMQHPAWMETDSALVLLLSGESGKALYSYNHETEIWKKLFDAGFENISDPVVHGHRVYFSGTFSGIDNIYCHDLSAKHTYQITSARFGAFQPQLSRDGENLVYSNYTAKGYGVATIALEEGLWKPLEEARDHTEQLDYSQTSEETDIIGGAYQTDTLQYSPRKYSKVLHLFNFHSWLPLYFDYLNPSLTLDPGHLPVSLGLSLISQNQLSTVVSQLGYEYRNGFHMFHSGIKLKGRYPVLNLYFDYGGEPDVLTMNEADSVIALPNDLRFTAQTYVPLRFNTGKVISLIQPRIDYSYSRDIQYFESEAKYGTGAHYLYYNLYATAYLRKSKKEIVPRMGLSTTAGYYHAPFNNQAYGSVAKIGITGYLPGLLKHQSIRLKFNYQQQYPLDMSHPAFIKLINLPRGLHGIFGEVLTGYSADYVFPLLYPDLDFGSLFYVKRIRGALWADYMKGTNVIIDEPDPHFENKNYSTIGADLVIDMNFLRIPFPLSVGGRVIYEPETGNIEVEWIYSIDIN
jgi:hypothetical protein